MPAHPRSLNLDNLASSSQFQISGRVSRKQNLATRPVSSTKPTLKCPMNFEGQRPHSLSLEHPCPALAWPQLQRQNSELCWQNASLEDNQRLVPPLLFSRLKSQDRTHLFSLLRPHSDQAERCRGSARLLQQCRSAFHLRPLPAQNIPIAVSCQAFSRFNLLGETAKPVGMPSYRIAGKLGRSYVLRCESRVDSRPNQKYRRNSPISCKLIGTCKDRSWCLCMASLKCSLLRRF